MAVCYSRRAMTKRVDSLFAPGRAAIDSACPRQRSENPLHRAGQNATYATRGHALPEYRSSTESVT